jgi:prepilin-type N-terminal cleavage/methylation domain-containing protein
MNQAGFTLVELLITMVAFVLVIAGASQIFTGLLTQFKQQSKIAETNIEGAIGLEILRQDLEHAGYGLPWAYSGAVFGYTEATSAPASGYNDTANTPPRAVLSGNNTGTNGSDYLVIKAVNVARNEPSRKSTRLISTAPYVMTWTPANENPAGTDRVIVIKGGAGASLRELVTSGNFYTTYSNVVNMPWRPSDATDNRIVYGINDNSASVPSMPFNRADYYISIPATNMPTRCATGTGVFYKATVNHADGMLSGLPLLDCVADMQVVYAMDNDEDGDFENGVGGDAFTNSLAGLTAVQIRTRVKAVEVYLLAHEGQRDPNFTFNNVTCGAACITVGRSAAFGQDFPLTAITNWQNYRWKIYTIVVKPENLRRE